MTRPLLSADQQAWIAEFKKDVAQVAQSNQPGVELSHDQAAALVSATADLFSRLPECGDENAREKVLFNAFSSTLAPSAATAFMARKLRMSGVAVGQNPLASMKQLADEPIRGPVQKRFQSGSISVAREAVATLKKSDVNDGLTVATALAQAQSAVERALEQNGEPERSDALGDMPSWDIHLTGPSAIAKRDAIAAQLDTILAELDREVARDAP